jgi:hypothetical protein
MVISLADLPDRKEQLPADIEPAGFLVGQNPFRGGEEGNSQTSQNLGNLISAHVPAPTGLAQGPQAGNDLLFRLALEFQVNPEDALLSVLDDL